MLRWSLMLLFLSATAERLAKLEVSATPSHLVVMEGQPVVLNCHAPTSSLAVNWSWHMTPLNRLGINVMYTGRDVVISRPEDSGYYHCMAQSLEMGINQTVNSSSFLIQVLAMPKTGLALVDHLGLAGFGLSLLGWLILLAALLFARGGYATCCTLLEEVISTSPKAKGLTGSKMATSDGLPHVESQGDYMNYTGTNLAYGDLKPNSMTGHNVYSNLS
ncbi:uncharacterized protein LOC130383195 isoform X2 [Gadus chalcogrammus]|uniref:uncharacterized protein LOC130383195 isoform X2 n=1 Tax=Gadus chalcogrammus TaxID=1042646 RepID=UPI0024C46117|nr:uncharacterized protein LOC130383195 isoform X2 [Gadus chalcogrammus]